MHAIYNDTNGEIGNIEGKFLNSQTDYSSILNKGKIDNIAGDFIDGYSQIENSGSIKKINGNFVNNYMDPWSNHLIDNTGGIDSISGNFISNIKDDYMGYGAFGAVIYNNKGRIDEINNAIFKDNSINSLISTGGGVIYNKTDNSQITLRGNNSFISNQVKNIKDEYIKTANSYGGAIYNDGNLTLNLDNANVDFQGNYVDSQGKALGGAIYSDGNLTINLDNSALLFKDNYAKNNTGAINDNAIYLADNSNLTFNLDNNSSATLYDNIRGNEEYRYEYKVGDKTFYTYNNYEYYSTQDDKTVWKSYSKYDDSTGDYIGKELRPNDSSKSPIELDNDTLDKKNATKYIDSMNVKITGDSTSTFNLYNTMYNTNLSLGGVTLNTIDNKIYSNPANPQGTQDSYHFSKITLSDNAKFSGDVDLKNQKMDRLTADSYGDHKGNVLEVVGLNLVSDTEQEESAIYFAQQGLKDNVVYNGMMLPDESQRYEVFTPIYKYSARYDNRNDGGYFVFNRASSNSSEAFNPSVLSSNVFSQAGSMTTINETFKYAFEHIDAFTQLPLNKRISEINKNKYALVEPNNKYNSSSTDFNYNLGSLNPEHNKAGWIRPYAVFENIPLKNGPKVDVISYGSLVGYDGEFKQRKHGFNSIGTMYLGYNGSSLKYSNVDTTMNGGLVGFTETFYRKNFWSATTLTAGANNGISHTMYGRENFTSLFAGIGQKLGYNFEFKDGKYIFQPMLFLSYSFINPFNYTNAAGVKINANPVHTLQINPNIRFVVNLKGGWQPYFNVGMVWNPLSESNYSANGIRLPQMSIKPYVEYDVGLQRNWSDRFTMFFQTMIRNGGRNGVALTAGFRWAIGKDYNSEKL